MEESWEKQLIKEDPLLQFKELRAKDVEHIASTIKNPRKTAIRRTKPNIRRYALRFYEDGIWAYKYLFDNASIYYISTAVEIGLLLKHRHLVKKEKAANPKLKIDFKWLIKNSRLGDEVKKLANNIRVLRNCYIHYQNVLAYNARLHFVEWPKFIEKQKSLAKNDPVLLNAIESVSDLVKRDYREETIPIRLEHLETNKEIMPFIEKRIKEYMNWVGQSAFRLQRFKSNSGDNTILTLQELQLIYSIEAFDALTCIKWSFDVLKALMIF